MDHGVFRCAAVSLTAALCGAAVAAAQPPGEKGLGNGEGTDGRFDKIGLTPAQHEKVRGIQAGHRAERKDLHLNLQHCKAELKAELDKASPDKAVVESKVAELKKLHAGLIDGRVSSVLELSAILTPEQLAKLRALRDDRAGGAAAGKGHRRGIEEARDDIAEAQDNIQEGRRELRALRDDRGDGAAAGGRRSGEASDDLAEAKDDLEEAKNDIQEGRRELREAITRSREELREELEKAAPDSAIIAGKVAELKRLNGQMIDERVDGRLTGKKDGGKANPGALNPNSKF